jgi:hypothetical protein
MARVGSVSRPIPDFVSHYFDISGRLLLGDRGEAMWMSRFASVCKYCDYIDRVLACSRRHGAFVLAHHDAMAVPDQIDCRGGIFAAS